jgi:hypothetical protein
LSRAANSAAQEREQDAEHPEPGGPAGVEREHGAARHDENRSHQRRAVETLAEERHRKQHGEERRDPDHDRRAGRPRVPHGRHERDLGEPRDGQADGEERGERSPVAAARCGQGHGRGESECGARDHRRACDRVAAAQEAEPDGHRHRAEERARKDAEEHGVHQ